MQEDIQSIKRYVVQLKDQGKTESEILEVIYKWGTQAVIAEVLNIDIRRLLLVVVHIAERSNPYQILILFTRMESLVISGFVMFVKGIITVQSIYTEL
ncbi:hypothetical protein U9K47_13575 [Bacillus toyonensis]|uniref:hypothetical protein n=1 Tax=Bacillus toyonensis TaxID=155322 RepID=UPI0034674094